MSASVSPSPVNQITPVRLPGLICKDLHGYLKTLPSGVLDKLYCHPATCLAVFRQLPNLARHYIIRLLYIEQPVPPSIISSWVTSKRQEDHKQAVKVLTELRIWDEHRTHGSLQGWMMNQTFREKFKIVMFGGGEAWAKVAETSSDKHDKDIPFLDQYARERWECILHFMVGSKVTNEGVSRDVVEILLYSGLMKSDIVAGPPVITTAGFQFLLMDTAAQIWFFMVQYLETVERRKMNLVEALSFLFQLSFSTLGKDYATDGLTEGQLRLLQHLREFGLVYQRKRKSQRYYPTSLAIELASGLQSDNESVTTAGNTNPGYIVVETNYRVYAYTCSELQVALLALFCDMIYRFSNMCVGHITRPSVRQALYMGITANQIINFLRSNAHPESLKHLPALPPTLTDQLRLWELERDRFQFTEGVLYNQFLSMADFELLRDYAKDLDCLVFEKPDKRLMVVSKSGHDDVKRFWKRQKRS